MPTYICDIVYLLNAMFSTVAPPTMFEVTEKTQTSLSFSWAPPIITGPVINYTLSCTTSVSGIDQPSPVQTAEQTATLDPLDPGVPYECSVSARTQRETSLEAVLTATTLETGKHRMTYIFMYSSVAVCTYVFHIFYMLCQLLLVHH